MPYTTKTLVAEFQSSNLTQKTFCKERSIPLSTLQYHLQKNRKFSKTGQQAIPQFVPFIAQATPTRRTPALIIRGDFSIVEIVEILSASRA